jgi:hypothetical protein
MREMMRGGRVDVLQCKQTIFIHGFLGSVTANVQVNTVYECKHPDENDGDVYLPTQSGKFACDQFPGLVFVVKKMVWRI